MSMKKKVVIRGPVATASGYGTHASQIARYTLARSDFDCQFILTPWGSTPWSLHESMRNGLIGEVIKRSAPQPWKDADLSMQIQLPSEWDPQLAKINIGITAGVETDKCNPLWIDCINRMNAIIVPSKHVAQTFKNTDAVTVPMHVVPEAFHDACASPQNGYPIELSTDFNFLIVGQLTGNNQSNDRKNTFSAIKWLCESFKDDPSVGIVVKINMGRNSCMDRQMTTNLMKQLMSEVHSSSSTPRIHLLHGDMTDDEIAALYYHPKIKALVTATRGEGFGLPILEAAASGLPVIATGWSGHLDYMRMGKFVELEYDMREVHPSRVDGTIFMQGTRWAEVREQSFKQKVTKFRNSPFIPKQWALELREKLLRSHSFEAISKQYDRALSELAW